MEIKNGKLVFDLWNDMRDLSLEAKMDMATYLSIDNDVFNNVVDQLITGYTEDISSTDNETINKAREKLTEHFKSVETELIRHLVGTNQHFRENERVLREWFSRLPEYIRDMLNKPITFEHCDYVTEEQIKQARAAFERQD